MNNIGFAVDLGTTTIDYCMMDFESVIAQSSFQNPQSLYGSDVINRIMTITRDSSYAVVLKKQITDAFISHFSNVLLQNNYQVNDVSRICICGNTTMISILLGLDVKCLGEAPFIPTLNDDVMIHSSQLFGEDTGFDCSVFLSGCASAFVGGDILAGISYLKRQFPDTAFIDNTLFIDLGTNGEIILFTNGRFYGAAAACGPAFENCTRRQKIYGATTIETISLCVATGKILSNGSFAQDNIKELSVGGMTLTHDILQNILLAKAAIAAGITTICKQANICINEINTVYLAGGFGFFLNIEHAIKIGLIPKPLKDKINVVGNTSLEGAKLLLTEEINKLTNDMIEVLNFAEIPSYQDEFIRNMYFQPSD